MGYIPSPATKNNDNVGTDKTNKSAEDKLHENQ